jgi:hypothetical protein
MSDPTFEPYLAEAIARTGVHRYRYLCLEHPDGAVRRGYQGLVIDIASGTYVGQRFDPDAIPTPGQPCCPGGDLSAPLEPAP